MGLQKPKYWELSRETDLQIIWIQIKRSIDHKFWICENELPEGE